MELPLEILPAGAAFQPWLGAFETLRVERGRALFVNEHADALRRACAALGLCADVDFGSAASALPPAAEGRWRWIISADAGAWHSFTAEKFPPRLRAFDLKLSHVRVGSMNLDARHKTLSYLAHWQARQGNPQDTEALLLNEDGMIASGAMTNIFWTRRDAIFTPPESCGCRAGVVREWIIDHARKRLFFLAAAVDALDDADEIFLTNSLLGICPVRRWHDRQLPAPGPLVQWLRRRYRLACQKQLR